MTDRELMQMALEALELEATRTPIPETAAAIEALRARLAEPEREPVAWIQPDHLQKARRAPFLCRVEPTKRMVDFVPLYTTPPTRRPLTNEEIDAVWRVACEKHSLGTTGELVRVFTRAIERSGYNEGFAVGVREGRLQMQAELTSELLQILQQLASRPQTVEDAEAKLRADIARAGGNDE